MLLPVLPGVCGSASGADLTEVLVAQGLSCICGQMVSAAGPAGP